MVKQIDLNTSRLVYYKDVEECAINKYSTHILTSCVQHKNKIIEQIVISSSKNISIYSCDASFLKYNKSEIAYFLKAGGTLKILKQRDFNIDYSVYPFLCNYSVSIKSIKPEIIENLLFLKDKFVITGDDDMFLYILNAPTYQGICSFSDKQQTEKINYIFNEYFNKS